MVVLVKVKWMIVWFDYCCNSFEVGIDVDDLQTQRIAIMNRQELPRIRLKVATTAGINILCTALRTWKVVEWLPHIEQAYREVKEDQEDDQGSKKRFIKALRIKKGNFYIANSELVGDIFEDNDEVQCQITFPQVKSKKSTKKDKSNSKNSKSNENKIVNLVQAVQVLDSEQNNQQEQALEENVQQLEQPRKKVKPNDIVIGQVQAKEKSKKQQKDAKKKVEKIKANEASKISEFNAQKHTEAVHLKAEEKLVEKNQKKLNLLRELDLTKLKSLLAPTHHTTESKIKNDNRPNILEGVKKNQLIHQPPKPLQNSSDSDEQ